METNVIDTNVVDTNVPLNDPGTGRPVTHVLFVGLSPRTIGPDQAPTPARRGRDADSRSADRPPRPRAYSPDRPETALRRRWWLFRRA